MATLEKDSGPQNPAITRERQPPENAYPEQWDLGSLDRDVRDILTLALPLWEWAKEDAISATRDPRPHHTRRRSMEGRQG
jgi:hypothetical protein